MERAKPTDSGNVGGNFEEEDLVTNTDEESEDEGKVVYNCKLLPDTILIYTW